MFKIPIRKRLAQLFCKHIYFAVAVTDSYQEIVSMDRCRVVIYECDKCEHVQITKKSIN